MRSLTPFRNTPRRNHEATDRGGEFNPGAGSSWTTASLVDDPGECWRAALFDVHDPGGSGRDGQAGAFPSQWGGGHLYCARVRQGDDGGRGGTGQGGEYGFVSARKNTHVAEYRERGDEGGLFFRAGDESG